MAKKKCIVIVDDDAAILAIIGDALAHPELMLVTANDALEAFVLAREQEPVLLISDIQMPGYGYGPETLKMLRADKNFPKIPILFMTGMDLAKAKALLPANDPTVSLMAKPLDLDKLREHVWKLAGVSAPV